MRKNDIEYSTGWGLTGMKVPRPVTVWSNMGGQGGVRVGPLPGIPARREMGCAGEPVLRTVTGLKPALQ